MAAYPETMGSVVVMCYMPKIYCKIGQLFISHLWLHKSSAKWSWLWCLHLECILKLLPCYLWGTSVHWGNLGERSCISGLRAWGLKTFNVVGWENSIWKAVRKHRTCWVFLLPECCKNIFLLYRLFSCLLSSMDCIECILRRLGFNMKLFGYGFLEISDLFGMVALNCWPAS